MQENCNYDKVKLLHVLSEVNGFLQRHARDDAVSSGHELCRNLYDELNSDIMQYMDKLQSAIQGLSKEEKFV